MGVIPKVNFVSNCLGGQHEGWLKCLRAAQLEKTSLVLLCCSGWQLIESKVGWWSSCLRRVWSLELQQKWLSVCTIERRIGDYTNTHSHYLTTKRPKPSKHTYSTWLTDSASDKCDTRDWLFIDQDDSCMIVNVTLCVSVADTFITNTTITYEAKTLSITRTWLQAWLRHQHAKNWMKRESKVDAKTHTNSRSEPQCVSSSSETPQGRL